MRAGQNSRSSPGRAEDPREQKVELGGRSESSRRAEQNSSRSKRRSGTADHSSERS
jgi:hypothetical protein